METKVANEVANITRFATVRVESGKQEQVKFDHPVRNASVAVQGFEVSYGNTDHHVEDIHVDTSISSINGNKVTVRAICTMKDGSRHEVSGSVNALVIAECTI